MTDDDRPGGPEQVRALGEAAVAQGWRRTAADRAAPRVAGSAPVSSAGAREALGLAFLAMSAAYLLRAALGAVRHREDSRSAPSGLLALPLAGASSGWRKAVADRVTPRVAARTPLAEDHARALVGAAFLGLSGYYVAGSARRFLRRRSSQARVA